MGPGIGGVGRRKIIKAAWQMMGKSAESKTIHFMRTAEESPGAVLVLPGQLLRQGSPQAIGYVVPVEASDDRPACFEACSGQYAMGAAFWAVAQMRRGPLASWGCRERERKRTKELFLLKCNVLGVSHGQGHFPAHPSSTYFNTRPILLVFISHATHLCPPPPIGHCPVSTQCACKSSSDERHCGIHR